MCMCMCMCISGRWGHGCSEILGKGDARTEVPKGERRPWARSSGVWKEFLWPGQVRDTDARGGEATSPNTPGALLRHLHFLEKVVGRPLVGWNTAIQCPFKHGPQRSKDRGSEPSRCWKQNVAGDFGAIIYAGKEEWGNRSETAPGSLITSIQGPFGRL